MQTIWTITHNNINFFFARICVQTFFYKKPFENSNLDFMRATKAA